MTRFKTMALASLVAALALALVVGTGRPVAAQDAGPAVDEAGSPGAAPAERMPHHHARTTGRNAERPLTVSRRAPPPFIEPGPGREFAGVGAVMVAPIQAAGQIADIPFRALDGIFPSRGDPARNPLVMIGVPLHEAAQVVQLPFRLIEAPFRIDGPLAF